MRAPRLVMFVPYTKTYTSTIFCALPPHYWADRRIKNNHSACIGAWFIISFGSAREEIFLYANTGGSDCVRGVCFAKSRESRLRLGAAGAREVFAGAECAVWRHYFRIWKRVGCVQINNHVVYAGANDFICFCLRYCLYWWNPPERANIVRKHAVLAVFCSAHTLQSHRHKNWQNNGANQYKALPTGARCDLIPRKLNKAALALLITSASAEVSINLYLWLQNFCFILIWCATDMIIYRFAKWFVPFVYTIYFNQ